MLGPHLWQCGCRSSRDLAAALPTEVRWYKGTGATEESFGINKSSPAALTKG